MKLNTSKVFVVHVSSDKVREEHMEKELGRHGISFDFMLKGDLPSLDKNTIDNYFSGDKMAGEFCPEQSCALKHIYIYEEMVRENIDNALIFEDDVFLSDNFCNVFNLAIEEFKKLPATIKDKALINFEGSSHNYVPRKERKKDQYLYPREVGRCAGAYFISKAVAQTILNTIKDEKCGLPIDWFHNHLAKKRLLNHYWCHPSIVMQGSHNGKMKSLIDDKNSGFIKRQIWRVSKWYKENFL